MGIENGNNIIPSNISNPDNKDLFKQNKFISGEKVYNLIDSNILYVTDSEEIGLKAGDDIITFKIVDGEIQERTNRGFIKSKKLIISGANIVFIGKNTSEKSINIITTNKDNVNDNKISNSRFSDLFGDKENNQTFFDEGDIGEAEEIYNQEIYETFETEKKLSFAEVMDNLNSGNELQMNDINEFIIGDINELGPDGLSKKLMGNLENVISDFSDSEKSQYLDKIYELFTMQVDEILEIDNTLNEYEIKRYVDFKSELKMEVEEVKNNDLYFGL